MADTTPPPAALAAAEEIAGRICEDFCHDRRPRAFDVIAGDIAAIIAKHMQPAPDAAAARMREALRHALWHMGTDADRADLAIPIHHRTWLIVEMIRAALKESGDE